MAEFRRTDGHKYSKLGVRRKNKQVYRKPRGGENKIRLNRAGRPRKVKIGFKQETSQRHLIKGKRPVLIYSVKDIKQLDENSIGIVGAVGNKKKKDIAKYVLDKKIFLQNFNPSLFLEKIGKKLQESKERKNARVMKKKENEKKSKSKVEEKKEKGSVDKKDNDGADMQTDTPEQEKISPEKKELTSGGESP